MKIILWILQVLLALAFLGAGFSKVVSPIDELVANGMTFAEHIPAFLTRLAGLSEVVGALGLILPAATRIRPRLTPIAAGLLALVMVLAVITHLVIGEYAHVVGPIVLGALSAFVAWGRLVKAPVSPRG